MKPKCNYMIEIGLGLGDKSDKQYLCTYSENCNSKIRSGFQDKCLYETLKNGNGLGGKIKSKLERVGE